LARAKEVAVSLLRRIRRAAPGSGRATLADCLRSGHRLDLLMLCCYPAAALLLTWRI
jgi:hypothetical protein